MQTQRREVLHYLTDNGRNSFQDWLTHLKDLKGQGAILKRIDRVHEGLLGDHASVGHGVWELRIHFGPGYRVYYGEDGPTVVLLLCGGEKSTQKRDILKAQEYWGKYTRANETHSFTP